MKGDFLRGLAILAAILFSVSAASMKKTELSEDNKPYNDYPPQEARSAQGRMRAAYPEKKQQEARDLQEADRQRHPYPYLSGVIARPPHPPPPPPPPPPSPVYVGFPYNYHGFPYNYVGFPYGFSYGFPAGITGEQLRQAEYKCPSEGMHYRDEHSFYTCADGTYRTMFCAPGSMNQPESHYAPEKDYDAMEFCSVNLTWYGSQEGQHM